MPWFASRGCCYLGLVAIALLLGAGYLVQRRATKISRPPALDQGRGQSTTYGDGDGRLRPLMFPCQTSHTRLFPKKHSFSYSYLMIGIPVGWQGAIKSVLSSDHDAAAQNERFFPKGWYHVEAEDYLDRGSGHLGLRGKLEVYLRSQDIDPKDYPHVYLITAPRFLGYAFNPVSFWYLYSEDMELTAMILEVNNTFDERRMYLLKPCRASPQSEVQLNDLNLPAAASMNFTKTWDKDFHVSPFNSRKGSYGLNALDPFSTDSIQPIIKNTITLRSSKGHLKLIAGIDSTGPTIDPTRLSRAQFAWFIVQWWWIGLATYPRILFEAFKLFFRKKLQFWFRPEVAETSIGRTETQEEAELEWYFRLYLRHCVKTANKALRVRYIAAGRHCLREDIFTSDVHDSGIPDIEDKELIFKVLTPAFYSEFIAYAHTMEALDRNFLLASDKERTIWISKPELLPLLFDSARPTYIQSSKSTPGFIDRLRWDFLRIIRRSRARRGSGGGGTDIRQFSLSEMDRFVRQHCNSRDQRRYRHTVAILLLCDRIAFGVPDLLRNYYRIFRMGLIFLSSYILMTSIDERRV